MITDEGAQLTWEILTGKSKDNLSLAQIRVGDGNGQTATAPLDEGYPTVERGAITLAATFTETAANFPWRVREILTAKGVVLDRVEQELGEKRDTSVTTLIAELRLVDEPQPPSAG